MNRILTIIIPAYNMEKYLSRCLASLIVSIDQMRLFEVLVINDGSKDKTFEIAHRYEILYPETFRVLNKENGHYGSCVNLGLKEATGTFVKILDADDSFDTDSFSKYLIFLSREEVAFNADIILSDYVQVDDNLTLIDKHIYSHYEHTVIPISLISPIDRQQWFIHGLAYRTSVLRDMHYVQTEGVAYTDIEWCFYPISRVRTVCRFEGLLYKYTKMREEQSVNPVVQGKNIQMQLELVKKMVLKSKQLFATISEQANLLFLKGLLLLNVTHVYQLYLLTLHRHINTLAPLLSFDNLLREEFPVLFAETNDYSTYVAGIKVWPIRLWRDNKTVRLHFVQALYSLADWKGHFFYHLRSQRNNH